MGRELNKLEDILERKKVFCVFHPDSSFGRKLRVALMEPWRIIALLLQLLSPLVSVLILLPARHS